MDDLFISGLAVPGEASETMVKLCLYLNTFLHKLRINCDYLVHSMYNGCVCTRATKEGENVKHTLYSLKTD